MAEEQANPQEAGPQLNIQRLYVKDISLETPAAPEIFKEQWQPKIKLDVNTTASQVEGSLHEVVLCLTVTASQNDKPCLLVEVQQAGLFALKGFDPEQLKVVLSTSCVDILFPYAREVIDTLANKASFPPFALAPMNFGAIFQQAQAQRVAQQEAGSPNH